MGLFDIFKSKKSAKKKSKKQVKTNSKKKNKNTNVKKTKKSSKRSTKSKTKKSKSKSVKRNSETKEMKFREILANGGLRARAIIEIIGKPLEHVDNVLNDIKEKIKSDYEVKTIKKFKPKENRGVFHGFIEADIYFKDFDEFTSFSFKYYPSSLEIIEPGDFSLNLVTFNSFFNDLLLKLHALGYQLKNVISERDLYKADIEKLLTANKMITQNLILITLDLWERLGRDSLSEDEIKQFTGLNGDISHILKELKERGRIIEKEGYYSYNR